MASTAGAHREPPETRRREPAHERTRGRTQKSPSHRLMTETPTSQKEGEVEHYRRFPKNGKSKAVRRHPVEGYFALPWMRHAPSRAERLASGRS